MGRWHVEEELPVLTKQYFNYLKKECYFCQTLYNRSYYKRTWYFCDQHILLTSFQHNINLKIGEENKALMVFQPAILGEQMKESGHHFIWHLWIILMDYYVPDGY